MCTTGPLIAPTGLLSALAVISILSSYVPFASSVLTFLFGPDVPTDLRLIPLSHSPLYHGRASHFSVSLLILFCYLLSTLLRITVRISKQLSDLVTVL